MSGPGNHWGRSHFTFRDRGYNIRWSWRSSTQDVDEKTFKATAKRCGPTPCTLERNGCIGHHENNAKDIFDCVDRKFPGKLINVVKRGENLWVTGNFHMVHVGYSDIFTNMEYTVWIMS